MVLQFPSSEIQHSALGRGWLSHVYPAFTELYVAKPDAWKHVTVDVMDHLGLRERFSLADIAGVLAGIGKLLATYTGDPSKPAIMRIDRSTAKIGTPRTVKVATYSNARAALRRESSSGALGSRLLGGGR